MKEIKLCVGITQEDELYFLEISPKNMSEGQKHFSMSGFTVKPILKEDAIQREKEYLKDGEGWRMAVESEQTTLGLDDWVEEVFATDGELAGFDNSLLTDDITVDGREYIFESRSCGQHEENDFKEYFIPEKLFKDLMAIWAKHHLKECFVELPELPKQDIPKLLNEAIRIIEDLPLLCTATDCEELQGEDGEFCEKHNPNRSQPNTTAK